MCGVNDYELQMVENDHPLRTLAHAGTVVPPYLKSTPLGTRYYGVYSEGFEHGSRP